MLAHAEIDRILPAVLGEAAATVVIEQLLKRKGQRFVELRRAGRIGIYALHCWLQRLAQLLDEKPAAGADDDARGR